MQTLQSKAWIALLTIVIIAWGIKYVLALQWRSPEDRITGRLHKIQALCTREPTMFLKMGQQDYAVYCSKLADEIVVQLALIENLAPQLSGQSSLAEPLMQMLDKWGRKAIEISLFANDGRFISDINYLTTIGRPFKKCRWKTLYPFFRP